ncbi:MAG: hypothetical protein ACRDD1_02330 [Planctomycetia bacterium]
MDFKNTTASSEGVGDRSIDADDRHCAEPLRVRAKISCRISIDSKGWFMSFYDHAGS